MGMIKCPDCGKEISDLAQSCPNCGRPLKINTQAGYPQKIKKKGHGCLITILTILMFVGTMFAVMFGGIGQSKVIQKQVSGVSDDSEYITMEEYNSIKTGMSYNEVKDVVGSSGEVSSQVEMNGIKIVIITWYGNGVAGSNANVTFTNDEVTAKAQVGLN